MRMRPVRTLAQYNKYMHRLEKLIDLDPSQGTRKADDLVMLTMVVEEYENKQFLFTRPTAIEAIKFRMSEQGLKQKDLIQYIGCKSKVSEVLSGKRTLSIRMIRNLVNGLGLSPGVLVGWGG